MGCLVLDSTDDSPKLINDFFIALDMHFDSYMTYEEKRAAYACGNIIQVLEGSTYQQVLDFMNLPSTLDRVEAIFAAVPTILDAEQFDPHEERGPRS